MFLLPLLPIHFSYMKFVLSFLCLLGNACFSQIPPGYYNAAAGLSGNALKTALHNIIKNHNSISYNSLWNAYKKTDVKPNGKVWDIYSDVPAGMPPYEFAFSTDQCGTYSTEGDCYNREHSWPQSWFNSVNGPVSDLFHIYPTDGKVNGMRNNYPYGHVGTTNWTSLNGGKLGLCTDPGFGQYAFEPIDAYKGDIARSYFYMSTRYYTEDASWTSSVATNKSTILPWQVNVLLQWHHQDPVSAKEIARTDSIYYRFQNNRNPFIDHPEWADSIWTMTVIPTQVAESGLTSNGCILYPNPAQDIVHLLKTGNTDATTALVVYCITTGQCVYQAAPSQWQQTELDCSHWAPGVYVVELVSAQGRSRLKFVKSETAP